MRYSAVGRLVAVICLVGLFLAHVEARENLVSNGDFEEKEDPLKDWNYNYAWMDNRHYAENHEKVGSVAREGSRRNVAYLWRKTSGQKDEVKFESKPIPFDYTARYKVSVDARTDGPNARIYVVGYKWRPGIRPHPDPQLWELRKIYKGKLLYFGSTKSGSMCNVPRSWATASRDFPMANASQLSMKHLKRVKLIVVYMVALEGGPGKLYVDNVKVEKIK